MLARINRAYVPAYWDDFYNDKFFSGVTPATKSITSPAVNVHEDEKSFTIELAAPGLSAQDFKIDLENDLLTISSEQEAKKEEVNRNYLRKEFNFSAFKRSFQLPDTIDTENIKASHDAGILRIELPKRAEIVQNAHRKIEIESAGEKVQKKK